MAGALRFALAELAGRAAAIAAEWSAKLTTHPWERARSVPDLRMMRPPGITWEQYCPRKFSQE